MKKKNQFLQLGTLTVIFLLITGGVSKAQNKMSDMHKQHFSMADNFAHKDIIILDHPYQPDNATRAKMGNVINAYLQIKDALVNDNEEVVNKATGQMYSAVAAIVPEKLEGKGLETWQNNKTLYEAKLKEMQNIKGLENKRSYFSHISEITYCMIKSFGLKQGNLYADYCPMALNSKGAYWISDKKDIQNPYLGAKMLTCGQVKEEL